MSAPAPTPTDARTGAGPPAASVRDTLRIVGGVLLPAVAQGVIARRRRAVALAGGLGLDDRAVRILQRMRVRYGDGPLRLRIPLRRVAVLLTPEHVRRVLAGSPEPFAAANLEKRAALRQFQPHGVLVSHGAVRAQRRRFVESVLDSGTPVHRMAEPFARIAREEALALRRQALDAGVLDWDRFIDAWWRVVRRVVLGDAARDDSATSDLLTRLRHRANWSYLLPPRRGLREEFDRRLRGYVDAAEPGSLAALVGSTPGAAEVDGPGQIPQWLFAFDPAGMAAFRALALLMTHPEQAAAARAEATGRDLSAPADLPLLRASVLESVRLWPTTAVVLRDTTAPTRWGGGTLAAGTALMTVSSYFHRTGFPGPGAGVPAADRFVPGRWLDGSAEDDAALIPFSAGPAACPGRELVLLTTSMFLATLLSDHDARPAAPVPLDPDRPLPRALDAFAIRVTLVPRADPRSGGAGVEAGTGGVGRAR